MSLPQVPDAPIPTIPTEAVDLAARARVTRLGYQWDGLDAVDQLAAREHALALLEAAAPVLYRTWVAAALRAEADHIAPTWSDSTTVARYLLHRAAELERGSTEPQPSSEPERKWKTINPLEWPVRVGPDIVGGGCGLGLACSVAAQQSAARPGVVFDVYDSDDNIVARYRDGVELRGSTDGH